MKSVVVCGSKRYKAEIAKFCADLEKLGVLVFEPSFDEALPEDTFIHSDYVTSKLFKGLTLEHFDWIRKAEVCYLFNKDNYVGISVTMEMSYASALGKPVFAMSPRTGDPCRDALIDKIIKTPKSLAALL
jgi:N-dimethylarginine dimethylaminohydrolase